MMSKKKRAQARSSHTHIRIKRIFFGSRVNERAQNAHTKQHWAYVSQSVSQSQSQSNFSIVPRSTKQQLAIHGWWFIRFICYYYCAVVAAATAVCCWNNHTKSAKNDDKHCNRIAEKRRTAFVVQMKKYWTNLQLSICFPFEINKQTNMLCARLLLNIHRYISVPSSSSSSTLWKYLSI